MANDTQVLFKCEASEKAAGEARAKEMGLTLSEMLRRAMVADEPSAPTDSYTVETPLGKWPLGDVRKALSDKWFVVKVWKKYLSGALRKAAQEHRSQMGSADPDGIDPVPTNGNSLLKHLEGCDCQRCVPPKADKKEPAKA